MSRPSIAASNRLPYIDSARGIAGVLAILAHLSSDQFRFIDFGYLAGISLFTRTATPMFMILFGIMIALVYIPRLSRGPEAADNVARRLLSRMVTCYLIFGAITLAAVLSGKIPVEKGLQAMAFANAGRFGEVLKIYSVLFLVIVASLPLLKRFGLAWIVTLAGLGWLLSHAVASVAAPGNVALQFFTGYDNGFGPSVAHSFTFVAFGVAIGEAVTGRRSLLLPGAVAAVAVAALAIATVRLGPFVVAHGLGTYEFRSLNHPLYYAYGIVSTSVALILFKTIWARGILGGLSGTLAELGKRSLFVYGFGNVAMNLLPTYGGNPVIALALAVAFMAVLILMTLDLARSDSLLDRATGGFLSRFRVRYEEIVQGAFGRLQSNLKAWRA